MKHALSLLFAVALIASVGCQAYVESTPRRNLVDDDPANYLRVFREPLPSDVTMVHSAVVTYAIRPGVVTTDDFEFELIAPATWIQKSVKRFHLSSNDSEFVRIELDARRKDARAWYAPGSLERYTLYRDATSVGYVHMLVQKEPEADGRQRVFLSKH